MFFDRKITVESFESETLPHFALLYRTGVQVIGNCCEAEDLVQEAYLQAWKSFHRFKPGTNCKIWLFKILFHVINHHRRRRFRSHAIKEREGILEELLIYEPPLPECLTDEEILAALQQVPAHFREVLLLADVEDFSYRAIADILGIPIGTVMSRLSRTRSLLRIRLAGFAQVRAEGGWTAHARKGVS